jgi:hypothetical protein
MNEQTEWVLPERLGAARRLDGERDDRAPAGGAGQLPILIRALDTAHYSRKWAFHL